jgi:hypothetical protein
VIVSDNYNIIGSIDPSTSVLLLGSGFSLEATNIRRNAPPNGASLRRHFLKELNYSENSDYALQILTDEFNERHPDRLFDELYEIFRVSKAGPNQAAVLSENWLRIYTTNYDDVVEFCHLARGVKLSSFDSSEVIPNRLPNNSIVHLHGSIRALTRENVGTSLVLGETSYVRQYVEKSPWYNQFQKDIRYASNVFIIGYSMADYHIAALLLEDPTIADKTFFIQRTPDPMFVRRTKVYGRPLFIGLAGLAEALKNLPRTSPLSDASQMKSFRLLEPYRDKKGLHPATAPEVFELLAYGTFNYSRCVATLPEQTYVLARGKEIKEFLEEFNSNRTIIVDGRLGNGKTIFLYLAFLALSVKGYTCFLFKREGADIVREIKLLQGVSKAVIIFEQYAAAQDILKRLGNELPNAKFVVEVRTSIFEVRFHEVRQTVPAPFGRVSLNRLSGSDVLAFKSLCAAAGIGSASFGGLKSAEIRDVLLEVLKSPNIKEKIRTTLSPVFENAARRKVLLLSTLLTKFHLLMEPSFIKSVSGIDPFKEFMSIKDVAEELFEIGGDSFQIRSSVFSEYAVEHFLRSDEIIECVVETALAAASRKVDRQFRVLMSSLMQYSNLYDMLRKESDVIALVLGIYERLRYDSRINDEPLFWLQYAIAMVEDSNLELALEFIGTAYERAEERTGFQTYQIDTQAFRILLLSQTQVANGNPVDRLPEIVQRLEAVNSMLGEESHRAYAIKVLEHVHPFVEKRRADLKPGDKTVLTYWLSILSMTLGQLPIEYRALIGSDMIKNQIDRAKNLLL